MSTSAAYGHAQGLPGPAAASEAGIPRARCEGRGGARSEEADRYQSSFARHYGDRARQYGGQVPMHHLRAWTAFVLLPPAVPRHSFPTISPCRSF